MPRDFDRPVPIRDGVRPDARPRLATTLAAPRRSWHAAEVDDVLDDSFPASDPPSWTTLRSGPPLAASGASDLMPT